ncbi:DegT/DnrJ/EryC1/StrS family aminotransferase [Jonquetella anthropi]|uniref:DegT/DnrJ/EryC1/StrS family aminotransferase n=1 Tax=Jonquetella anthropi TaxID=428712 RepID=UPI0001B90FCB|nr:DegT/DnrJ/EryC1/StrS family aminotransferase [Jonquetella anthropi]EEX49042.1 pleiotropic regulatory protein DegT [Jonquetella anthropi E3_33 E1]
MSLASQPIPSFDLHRNYARVKDEINAAVARVLESQQFIMGSEVSSFEAEAASFLGAHRAIACASGSDALVLSMMALDLKPGDEVITTPFSFFATVSCITRAGATPKFVDVDPATYNIDLSRLSEAITDRTRAMIPVHLFGQMVPLEQAEKELAERHITVVEDSAQAFGSWRRVGDRMIMAGAWGDLGCYSFFPTKNLGCYGDAGMVTARDDRTADRIAKLRVHGAGKQYFHEEVGLNSRMDALQAAILRVRLAHLPQWIEERRAIAERYRLLFEQANLTEFVTPPAELQGNCHTYHQYVIRAKKRDELMAFMAENGVATRVYYPQSLHLQKCFASFGGRPGQFPVSEQLTQEVLALPMFPELTADEQARVVETMSKFYRKQQLLSPSGS